MRYRKASPFRITLSRYLLISFCFCSVLFLASAKTSAQSRDQNLPSPITSNQVNGEIKARDIGDSRLTTYYFLLNGKRGDIFINVVTANLNGDIDIFTREGLKPKTKITIFADDSQNETGRIIYLRKPEKLILRIQGRTPNDDAATFQLKFAGSFSPLKATASIEEPKVSNSLKDGVVRVNSVGTIIEDVPRPTPQNTDITAKNEDQNDKAGKKIDKDIKTNDATANNKKDRNEPIDRNGVINPKIPRVFDPTKKVDDIIKENLPKKNPSVVVSDPFSKDKNKEREETTTNVIVDLTKKPNTTSAIVRIERVTEDDKAKKQAEKTKAIAKIFLKVDLKNGDLFVRSMGEVQTINVIKGVLTIVTTDGKIQEFSILDVVKMTIE